MTLTILKIVTLVGKGGGVLFYIYNVFNFYITEIIIFKGFYNP